MACLAKLWRAATKARLSHPVARLGRRSISGSAALEFAFIAPIFLLFLMGTLEVAMIFMGNMVLLNAVNDAAREIRTGQIALGNKTQTDFRNIICSNLVFLQCDGNLQIDVESFPTFGTVTLPNGIRADGTLDPSLNNWQPGTVCSIVVVRAYYTWTVTTPLLTPFLVNMANSQHLITAAAAFRNEPYTSQVAGC